MNRILCRVLPLALLATIAAPALAQPAAAPFTIVESGRGFYRLDDAVRAVGEGEATIRIASGRYRDCAVQEAGRISFRAAEAGKAIFDGGICEGKAVLVLRGRGAVVDGVIFENLRVPDGNGAGIRLESGDLTVTNAMFRNSEEGILSADDINARLVIDRSTFSGLGRCDRGLSCAHSIYIGNYGSLTVTHSRFERGTGGHYVKTWTPKVDIRDNSFDDTGGRTTNYMIDLPGGATGTISGNVFVQGRDKENYSAFIAVAAEERKWRIAGLSIAGNEARLAPGVDRETTFVADWSHEPLSVGENKLGAGLKRFETR